MSNSSNHLTNRLLLTVFLLAIVFSFTECKKWMQGENETRISRHGDHQGHKKGQNCMNCHYTEGKGESWFLIGGSVYGNIGDGTAYFYKDTLSPAIDSLEIDADGNLFTTKTVDFSNGLYVSVKSGSGTLKQMPKKVFNGQCNLCHGVTQSKISF